MKRLFINIFFLCSVTLLSAQIDRSVQPKPGPAPEINLGTPKTFTVPNGLKVLVVEDHKLPRVIFSLTLDNPPILEGEEAGVSSLTSQLMGQGSVNIPKEEFYEEVDYLGARVSVGVNGGVALGLSKYTDRLLELFADAALNPDFNQEALENERQKLIENLKTGEKDVSRISGIVSDVLAYGITHPKGEFIKETTVNNVSLGDVKAFYSAQFVPGNAYMIVVGDVEFEKIKKDITAAFSTWKKATPLTVSYTAPKDAQYTQINFVDMPNAVQSEIKVQNLIELKLGDKDYFPALIANYILGGGGDGRLFQVLREEKGYTYGAYSGAGTDKYGPSVFRASASVRNEVTDSAVVAFLEVIENFKNNPVTDVELKNAKAKYSGNFVMSLEDAETTADLALNIERNNLPEDFYRTYLEKINAVTKEDVQRVAEKFLKTGNMKIVVVGKGSEVAEDLEAITFKGKKLPVWYFDKEGNKIEKPNYSAALPDGVTVQTVLSDYVNAIGGKETLQKVESVFLLAEANMQGMTLNLEMKKGMGKYAMDMKMQGNSVSKQVYNGESAFVIQQGQKQELPADKLSEMKQTALPFPELNWLDSEEITLERIADVDGKKAYVLKVAPNKHYYYDTETGLKIMEESTVDMGGQTIQQTSRLSNYQEVQGIKFPYTLSQTVGPQKIDMEVTDIKINEGVTEADFQ